jgi:hypothetical protein
MNGKVIPTGYVAESNQINGISSDPSGYDLSREWIRYGSWSGFIAAAKAQSNLH